MSRIDKLIDKLQFETKIIVRKSTDVDALNNALHIASKIIEDAYNYGYLDGKNKSK